MVLAWAFWVLAVAPVAEEEPPPTPVVQLEWTAPPECPTREEVQAQIVELVGRPLGQDSTRILDVQGVIVAAPGSYTLSLRSQHPDGVVEERELSATVCRDLGEPAAVVVAIAVEGPVQGGADAPSTDVDPSPPQEMVAEAPALNPVTNTLPLSTESLPSPGVDDERAPMRRWRPRQPQPAPTSDGLTRFVVGVSGGLTGGSLPRVGPMVQGSVGLLRPGLRLDLVVAHAFRRTLSRGTDGSDFALTVVRPELCVRPGRAKWRIPVCAGPELGVLRAWGGRVASPNSAIRLWMAIAAGTGLVWAPHHVVALRLRGEAVVAPVRRGFTIDGLTVYTTGVFGGRASLGIEIRLP